MCNNGIRIIRGGNIQNGEILDFVDDVHISEKYKNSGSKIKANDIVLVASTGSADLIGKIGYAKRDYDAQIGAFLRIIRCKQDVSDYTALVFQSDCYKKYIKSLAKGTNINNIKNDYILNFTISIPPLVEQKRIVLAVNHIFSRLDAISESL